MKETALWMLAQLGTGLAIGVWCYHAGKKAAIRTCTRIAEEEVIRQNLENLRRSTALAELLTRYQKLLHALQKEQSSPSDTVH